MKRLILKVRMLSGEDEGIDDENSLEEETI